MALILAPTEFIMGGIVYIPKAIYSDDTKTLKKN